MYKRPHKYTQEELADAWKKDLLADAKACEEQAITGPFYPGITKEDLLKYAAQCRKKVQEDEMLEQFKYSKVAGNSRNV